MNCPACGRKLLSQASARCNWCGETVPDAAFQAGASTARAAYFAHIAAHDAASLLAMEVVFQTGPVLVQPLPPVQSIHREPPPAEDAAPEPVTTEQDDARARFRHLEL